MVLTPSMSIYRFKATVDVDIESRMAQSTIFRHLNSTLIAFYSIHVIYGLRSNKLRDSTQNKVRRYQAEGGNKLHDYGNLIDWSDTCCYLIFGKSNSIATAL